MALYFSSNLGNLLGPLISIGLVVATLACYLVQHEIQRGLILEVEAAA